MERGAVRLVGALGSLRERIVERLRWVNDLTQREVIAAGAAIEDVVAKATSHISWLRDVLGRVGGGDNPMSRAIQNQADIVRDHVSDLVGRLATHDEHTQRAVEQVAHTLEAATAIAMLTRQAKILALNAQIESVRTGERVSSFAVIAEEMSRLSNAVAQTNDRVQTLVRSLHALLPEMAAQTRELRERAEGFATTAANQITELEQLVTEMRGDVSAALTSSDETIASIISHSHAALSHLQFQDVASQRVMHVDNWVHETQVDLVREAAPEHVAEIAPPASTEVGGGYVDDANAGEVMLF